jgi:hypothetical protein
MVQLRRQQALFHELERRGESPEPEKNKTVYFSVDTDAMPNTGVKGKGTAAIIKDPGKMISLSEKIVAKYLGDLNSKVAKGMLDEVKKGAEVLVEITPRYFSAWDYTKSKI